MRGDEGGQGCEVVYAITIDPARLRGVTPARHPLLALLLLHNLLELHRLVTGGEGAAAAEARQESARKKKSMLEKVRSLFTPEMSEGGDVAG